MADESIFFEEVFYGQSGCPSSIPSTTPTPTPTGKSRAATYASSLTRDRTLTMAFNLISNHTISSNIHSLGSWNRNGRSGSFPLIAHDASSGSYGSFVGNATITSSLNSLDFHFVNPADEFSTDCPYHFALRIQQGSTNIAQVVLQSPIDKSTLGTTIENGSTFLTYLPQVFLPNSPYNMIIYIWADSNSAPHWEWTYSGTFTVTITYTLMDSVPFCFPPTIQLSSDNQTAVSNGYASPASVTFTLSGGYQLGKTLGGYLLQRRKINGSQVSAWENVTLLNQSFTTNDHGAYVVLYSCHMTYGSNVMDFEEVEFQTTMTLTGQLTDAAPPEPGAYYQYRARTVLNATTSWNNDWVCYLVDQQTGEMTIVGYTVSNTEDFEASDALTYAPWSDTVQCQKLITLLPPSNVQLNPTRGEQEVTVSWTPSDVSGIANTYQESIDYYIRLWYTKENGSNAYEVVWKASAPATASGRVSVKLTNDATQANGVLAKVPGIVQGTIYFTVYAVYGTMTSDFIGWTPFSFGPSGLIAYYDGSNWQNCIVYYRHNDEWIECVPYYFHNGQWVECST